MKILVVDDQRELLHAIGLMLELDGFCPSLACGGQSAFERIRNEGFDLLLCDVEMPCLTGPELFRRVQGMGLAIRPRFIFMSAGFTQESLQAELGTGNISFLRKPFDLQALKAALQQEQNNLRGTKP